MFVQSSTQHPTETQEIVAHVLGLKSHDVTVQCLRMGGGFGGKEMQPHGLAAVAALGSTLTGRPVRLRLNRTQDLTMTGKRHGFHASWQVGFDDDGRLQALEGVLTSDGGWSLDLSEPEEDEGRDEEDPAADAEDAGEEPRTEAETERGRDRPRAHPTISQTPTTTSKPANASVSARPDTRCWSWVPASAPTTAGSPTSAAYPGRTSPRTA